MAAQTKLTPSFKWTEGDEAFFIPTMSRCIVSSINTDGFPTAAYFRDGGWVCSPVTVASQNPFLSEAGNTFENFIPIDNPLVKMLESTLKVKSKIYRKKYISERKKYESKL